MKSSRFGQAGRPVIVICWLYKHTVRLFALLSDSQKLGFLVKFSIKTFWCWDRLINSFGVQSCRCGLDSINSWDIPARNCFHILKSMLGWFVGDSKSLELAGIEVWKNIWSSRKRDNIGNWLRIFVTSFIPWVMSLLFTNLALRFRFVAAGFRTPNLPLAGQTL